MISLDPLPSQSSVPLLQTQGSGFPPQPVDAVWLSQTEAAVVISERWAVIPGQAVRVMGPLNFETGKPEWQAVAKVESIQPYLDGQRVCVYPCWGRIAANAAWLEGLATPIEFLLDTTLAQHPTARSMQLLGQPIGISQPLQGQGWKLTGTCVAGKQALLKELLAGFNNGWILDASGWYESIVSVSGQSGQESAENIPITALQRFELAQRLCASLGNTLSTQEKTALLQASTNGGTSLYQAIEALCETVPLLPPVPRHAITNHYWNLAAIPSCWQTTLANVWAQRVHQNQPPVVVIIWPEALTLDSPTLFKQWREQGTCVVWLPQGDHNPLSEKLSASWHCLAADIAWPLAAMESDALGSVRVTNNLPYDVAFTAQGPTTWQLPVCWMLPGAVLPAGPVEWQAYGVQHTPTALQSQWAKEPSTENDNNGHKTPNPLPNEATPNLSLQESLYESTMPTPVSEVVLDEPAWTAALLPTGLMAELGPLPDLSDLSSLGDLGELGTLDERPSHNDVPISSVPMETPTSEAPVTLPQAPPVAAQPPQPVATAAQPPKEPHSAFAEGQAVHHTKYGHGTIIQIIPTGQRHTLQVTFNTAGTRLLDATQSGLEAL